MTLDLIFGRDASPRRPLFEFSSPDGSESRPYLFIRKNSSREGRGETENAQSVFIRGWIFGFGGHRGPLVTTSKECRDLRAFALICGR